MKYVNENRDVPRAVSMILQGYAGMDKPSAEEWTQRICTQAEETCGAIRALEACLRSECSTASDLMDALAARLALYDQHISLHGDPMVKPRRTLKEEAFCRQLEQARRSLDGHGSEFIPKPAKLMLLTELSIRNELYYAMDGKGLDTTEPLKADRIACRNCSYTLAIWMRAAVSEGDLPSLALRAAALDRLGYLDHDRIAQLHAAAQRKLNEME